MHNIYRVYHNNDKAFKYEAFRHHPGLSIHLISTGANSNYNDYINESVSVYVAISDEMTLAAFSTDLSTNTSLKNSFKKLSNTEFYL